MLVVQVPICFVSPLFLVFSQPVTTADLRGDSEPALTVDGPEDVWRDAQVN